ncbi:MAG: hypothetical protein HZB67_00800 [Candidatus Aenigmarchaeota archaeon]|nr:hypothetical protein [Candidatus Aenigmarchaeota archaeon]
MRIEYVIVSIILMLVVVLAVIAFLSGSVPSFRIALDNFICGLGLDPTKCKTTP